MTLCVDLLHKSSGLLISLGPDLSRTVSTFLQCYSFPHQPEKSFYILLRGCPFLIGLAEICEKWLPFWGFSQLIYERVILYQAG